VIGRLENGMVVDEKSALRSEMRKQADLTQKKMLFTNGAHSFRAKVRYQMAILPKAIQGSLIPLPGWDCSVGRVHHNSDVITKMLQQEECHVC
jgi:hypothetical protein